jgi:polygalacturonase
MYNVLDFGAKGLRLRIYLCDGLNNDSHSIQKAIDKCFAQDGGGRVILHQLERHFFKWCYCPQG